MLKVANITKKKKKQGKLSIIAVPEEYTVPAMVGPSRLHMGLAKALQPEAGNTENGEKIDFT